MSHFIFFILFFFIFSKFNFNHLLTDWCLIWKYTLQFLKRSTDIHRLSNIHILTYGISGATGAERRSRACVTGGISLSPLRGQSLSSSLFSFSNRGRGGHFIAGWVGGQICCSSRWSLSRSVYTQRSRVIRWHKEHTCHTQTTSSLSSLLISLH